MERLMDWMKILNKGWMNVIQMVIIVALFIFIVVSNSSGKQSNLSIREDIASARELVERVEKHSLDAIDLVTGVIDSNERVIEGLNQLTEENRRARDIAGELADDNIEHTKRIRAVQDSTLNGELATDRVSQIIREIERENGYD